MDDKDNQNRRLRNKIVIEDEMFNNLLKMLESPSEEDQVVALTSINNLESSKNLIQTLFLRKEGRASYETWKEHAPKVIKYHNSKLENSNDSNIITFSNILYVLQNQIKDESNKKEALVFFTKRFEEFFKVNIKNFSNIIEAIDIKIKFKNL